MKALVIMITQKNIARLTCQARYGLYMPIIPSLGRMTKTGLDHRVTFRLT